MIVGVVLKAPVTLIPVSPTTGASVDVGALALGLEVEVDDGWVDEGLDPADEERELEEHALSVVSAASSSTSSVGRPRNPVRATLPIDFDFHSVGSQAVV